jgi:hypothetical protein
MRGSGPFGLEATVSTLAFARIGQAISSSSETRGIRLDARLELTGSCQTTNVPPHKIEVD